MMLKNERKKKVLQPFISTTNLILYRLTSLSIRSCNMQPDLLLKLMFIRPLAFNLTLAELVPNTAFVDAPDACR